MNKIYKILIFICVCFCQLMAESNLPETRADRPRTMVELRCAAFFPANHRFRSVYSCTLPSYQVEINLLTCHCFDVWANLDFINRKKSHDGCKSKIDLFNSSVGLKYIYPLCGCFENVDLYAGAGICFGYVNLRNRSPCNRSCGNSCESKYVVGGVFKSGLYYHLCHQLFLDLFVDYLYEPVHFKHRTTDVGGVRTGLGLGYAF